MKLTAQQLEQLSPEQKRNLLQQLLARTQKAAPRVLSPAQHGLWVAHQLDPERFTDHLLNAYRLRGPLNQEALERALQAIVDCHETLRTHFLEEDGEARPQVAEKLTVQCARHDLSGQAEPEKRAHQLAIALVRERFDLASGPLFRFALVTLGADEHLLLLVLHHIVADNWSFKVFNEALEQLYSAGLAGRSQTLAPLAERYSAYSARERAFLESAEYTRQAAFWKAHLADFKLTELPMDFPRPELEGGIGATARFQLDSATATGLRRVAERCKASSFMTFLAAFNVLVHRYTDQDDLAIGVPVANRHDSSSQAMIGFFVNTLVARTRFTPEVSFAALLSQVRDNALTYYDHSRLPFEHVVEQLGVPRNLSRNPLVPLIFQSGLLPELNLPGLAVAKCFEADYGVVRCDLEFYLVEERDGLTGTVIYNRELFRPETIERLCGHFQVLAAALAEAPDTAVDRLPLLTAAERHFLLVEVNATARAYQGRHLLAAIAARVEAASEQLAVQAGEARLTYGELWQTAGQLAAVLRGRGVRADVPVGICMARGLDLAVALLGVLRAGGAYLPLDPSYPAERLAYLVEDSHTPLVLVQTATREALPGACQTLALDAQLPAATALPLIDPLPEQLAYVIYTSGSTGKPKGVMVSHGAIYNTLVWRQRVLPLGSDDRVLQTTSFSFDASVWEFFGPLIAGATLDLSLGPGVEGRLAIPQLVRDHRVTCMQLPPAWLKVFLEAEGLEALVSLRCLTTGAEPVSQSLQRQLFGRLPIRFANHYGPTEAALDVTAWECRADDPQYFAPIGQPIDNVQVYLVDRHLELKQVGRAGRLLIGGAGLARGYSGSPRLTAERFLPDPFGGQTGARLYDSGDLARWERGQLHFLGRSDNQVKIRGFRIEIGEITAAIEQMSAVRQAVVIVREDRPGDKRLVAYVVAEGGHALDQAGLRQSLGKALPEHMVPHAFVLLERLPLSPNGKLELTALPLPQGADEEQYQPPSNELESQLAEIWSQVLGLPRVGVNDNFFALGGDSILAIQVIAAAAKQQLRLTPKAIFSHQTIARLAQHLDRYQAIEEQDSVGAVALSPIQRWFFDQDRRQPQTFNQAFLLELRQSLELANLRAALADLSAHHDSLRLRFARSAEGWQAQFGNHQDSWQVSRVDLSAERDAAAAMTQHAATAGFDFDLNAGPVAQALVYHWGGSDRYLLLGVHHLVIDGYSWRVLLEDLESALVARARNRSPELPPRTTSWQSWMGAFQAGGARFRQQRDYWRDQVERLPACTAPTGSVASEVLRIIAQSSLSLSLH